MQRVSHVSRGRSGRLILAAFATPLLAAACSGPHSVPIPLAPTAVSAPVLPSVPSVSRGPASLIIEAVSVATKFPPTDGYFYYYVRFLVRETSGNTAATIENVVVNSPDHSLDTGRWCWGDYVSTSVMPGGTLDVFYSDAGAQLIGDYCAPATRARSESFPLTVILTFRDEGGNEGTVETTVNLVRGKTARSSFQLE